MPFPRYVNQGQAIVANWNNASNLKNITAYQGTDGLNFLPVFDRGGFTTGVTRNLTDGSTRMSGYPIVRLTSPWISDGQIDYLYSALLSGSESGMVTVKCHQPTSQGLGDTANYNAFLNLNLNQLATLTRKGKGYTGFVWTLPLVLAL